MQLGTEKRNKYNNGISGKEDVIKKISAIILDDEHFAREEIKHQLSVYPEIELVAESDNGVDGLQKIRDMLPNLIFLDIEMPGMKGMEVAGVISTIQNYNPYVVFITAYDNYALRAFEYGVVDYLLKPIEPKRFAIAIGRVTRYFSSCEAPDCITAKKGSSTLLINTTEISFITMDEGVVYIHAGDKAYCTKYRTLEDVEKELDTSSFMRTHRAYVVNLKKVREIKQCDSGALSLKLQDVTATEIPVSRNKVKDIKGYFNI